MLRTHYVRQRQLRSSAIRIGPVNDASDSLAIVRTGTRSGSVFPDRPSFKVAFRAHDNAQILFAKLALQIITPFAKPTGEAKRRVRDRAALPRENLVVADQDMSVDDAGGTQGGCRGSISTHYKKGRPFQA